MAECREAHDARERRRKDALVCANLRPQTRRGARVVYGTFCKNRLRRRVEQISDQRANGGTQHGEVPEWSMARSVRIA